MARPAAAMAVASGDLAIGDLRHSQARKSAPGAEAVPMRLPRDEFEGLVAKALADLPEEFAQRLRNVEVVVEDWPGPEHYGERGLAPGVLLLGLYHGVPLTKRSAWASPLMPDRITIFQGSIERVTQTPEQIIAQVRHTVLHEIAHHFGISDQRLRELGC